MTSEFRHERYRVRTGLRESEGGDAGRRPAAFNYTAETASEESAHKRTEASTNLHLCAELCRFDVYPAAASTSDSGDLAAATTGSCSETKRKNTSLAPREQNFAARFALSHTTRFRGTPLALPVLP